MDYLPTNFNADPEAIQGDYSMIAVGPYDYWAIEYAYKSISGNEKEELKKIAANTVKPTLCIAE